ncbi:glycerophosphocholine cholinephosphodiesterase ENPP6-like isoform X2 [Lineus longissimus]
MPSAEKIPRFRFGQRQAEASFTKRNKDEDFNHTQRAPPSCYLKYLCPYLLLLLMMSQVQCTLGAGNKLLVLLVDGLRWDYVNQADLPGFQTLFESGSHVHHIDPEFPTLCYPNYYSFVTGLFPENHGMIGNNMYDSIKNEYFSSSMNTSAHWWEDGEPIWVTAKKQGKRSYLFHWPGCNRSIRDTRPDYCRPYVSFPSMQEYMGSMVEGLNALHNDSADFVGLYNEHLDMVGHRYGPNSKQLRNMLIDLDKTIVFLLQDLTERGLRDKVNVLLLSDHGMTDISMERIIDLRRYISKRDLAQTLDGGSYTNIWPLRHVTDKVYKKLKNAHPNMTIYQKHTLPDVWHYQHSHRVAPLTAVADNGWYILTYTNGYVVYTEKKRPALGWHGYSSQEPDMWPMFAGSGPDIVRNQTLPSIRMTDIYQMMCHLLKIEPAPHNGTWPRVERMIATTMQDPIHGVHQAPVVILGTHSQGQPLTLNFVTLTLGLLLAMFMVS